MRGFGITVAMVLMGLALMARAQNADIIFEKNLEYSNPDNQHLMVTSPVPRKAKDCFRRFCAFMAVDFGQGRATATMTCASDWRCAAMWRQP